MQDTLSRRLTGSTHFVPQLLQSQTGDEETRTAFSLVESLANAGYLLRSRLFRNTLRAAKSQTTSSCEIYWSHRAFESWTSPGSYSELDSLPSHAKKESVNGGEEPTVQDGVRRLKTAEHEVTEFVRRVPKLCL
jgi:hypothetical protein